MTKLTMPGSRVFSRYNARRNCWEVRRSYAFGLFSILMHRTPHTETAWLELCVNAGVPANA